jgi:hypothetical protein
MAIIMKLEFHCLSYICIYDDLGYMQQYIFINLHTNKQIGTTDLNNHNH